MSATSKVFQNNEENKEIILEELGCSLQAASQRVENLKEWLNSQKGYPNVLSDSRITMFLATNKFDLEKAKGKLKHYFESKNSHPDFFQDPCTPKIREVLKAITLSYVPELFHRKYKVVLINTPENADVDSFVMKDFISYIIQSTDLLFEYDFYASIILISDVNFSWKFLTKFNPICMATYCKWSFKSYTSRVEAIYILNCPTFAKGFINFILSFFPVKMQKRVRFLGSSKELLEYLPRDVLPEDYGGAQPPVSVLVEDLWKVMEENIELLRLIKDAKVQDEDVAKNPQKKSWSFFGSFGNYK